ncbi:MAG: cobalamin B12-binding domain-containing protein [Desulfuromonadales bacterium]|nr:cobalamin B12-binding domain-containing protein [Desulfuromonadales bacterium]
MKILLVNPPNSGRSIPEERYGIDSIKQIFRGEPLALEVLAGNLDGHEVRIFDLKVEPDGLEAALAAFRPGLVGVTAVTCEANAACHIAAVAKESCGASVAVGGIHASNDPEFFNRPEIDFVVVGIGKASFRELVEALARGEDGSGLPGVAKSSPGTPLRYLRRDFGPADLVEAKPPRYDLVATNRGAYTLLGRPLGFVTSAFGCPFDCSFCCIGGQAGGRYLACSIEAVIRDIGLLPEIPFIRLVDANTFGSPEHARRLCRAIRAAGLEKSFLADVRSDTVVRHPDLIREWQEAGLRSVVIGFEEICDSGLAQLNKANSVAVNQEAIGLLREIGITIVGDFIVSPDYGHADFDRLLRYLEANPIDLPIFTVLTPLPGTALHRQQRERIVNHDLDFYTLANAVVPTRLEDGEFYRRYAELFQLTHPKAKI